MRNFDGSNYSHAEYDLDALAYMLNYYEYIIRNFASHFPGDGIEIVVGAGAGS